MQDCHFLVTFAFHAEDRPPQFFERIGSKGTALTQQRAAVRQNTGSRQELQDLVRAQLQALLEQENLQGAKALLVPVQPADIAEAIEELPEAMQALAFRLLSKDEAIAGAMLGVMLGVVVTIWAFVLQGNLAVAIAVGISLFAISAIASVSGSALPFLFRSFGLDPALMSAPFITTAVDVLGVLIYLNVARWILRL